MKKSPFKLGLLVSALTFMLLLILMTAQFIYKYKRDLFGKNLESWIIPKVLGISMATLVSFILPISILVFSFVYYKQHFQNNPLNGRIVVRKSILPISIFSFACFIWVAFINPAINLRQSRLLYDITSKAPDKPIEWTDINLFRHTPFCSNLIELAHLEDSSEAKINRIKKQTTYSILSVADSVEVNELLQDSISLELGLTQADFINEEMKNDGHIVDTAHQFRRYLHRYLEEGAMEIQFEKLKVLKVAIYRANMIRFPFVIFISFFLGMAIGILNRKQEQLIPFIIGIFFIIFPVLYYTTLLFDKFVKEQKLSLFHGQLYLLLTLAIPTFFLYKYAMKQTRNEEKQST